MTRANDKAPAGALTAKEQAITDASTLIFGQRPTPADFAYTHALLCQVGLPRSKVDGDRFERTSGRASLMVTAGELWDGKAWAKQPLPYGSMPRLVLAWISTYAVRNNSAEIPVGDSASEFLRMLGITKGGGKSGAYTTFRKQVSALAACRLQIGYTTNNAARTFNGQPIESFDAWLTQENQRSLWPGQLILSRSYYETLRESAVPLDNRALQALKGSSLSLDLYAMLAHRLHRIEGRSLQLYWHQVKDQFGQEYQGVNGAKDFKRKFLTALRDVQAVYPQARVKQIDGGLLLQASPPPIAKR
ncbi:replication protein [Xanthomonas arboricola pv. corylina]|uniref:replication protein RepA n=1 Tax=Xanthomonas arboricola TaxID=56448 RepID=UPI000CEEB3CA|nr:replication protein RepA [Xanthomonas arboricola]PPU05221.1 replication protein [Xanthomonas arboricola pv. corylina]